MSFLDDIKKKGKKRAVEDIMKRGEFKTGYNLTVEERITKARISLQKRSPFFSYLVMHLNFEKSDNMMLTGGSLGVDPDGNVFYNEEFMKKLNEEELMTAICHEVSHVGFIHLTRRKSRDPFLYNVAADSWVNNTLQSNGFQLIPGGVMTKNNNFSVWGIIVSDINKKSVEDIYDELYSALKDKMQKMKGGKNGKSEGDGIQIESDDYQIDQHNEESQKAKGKNGKGENKENGKNGSNISRIAKEHGQNAEESDENQDGEGKQGENPQSSEEKWARRVAEGYAYAKNRGITPAGIDRHIDQLLHPQQNWEQILYRYITNELAVDTDWSYPSRRSQSTGFYLPHTKKENIELACWLDTSGSIDETQLKYFCGLLQEVVDSFQNINMTVISCDSEIHHIAEIGHGKRDVLQEVKPKGGGGTDVNPVLKYIKEKKPNTKLLICVTDGEIFHKPNLDGLNAKIIWLIPENGGSTHMVKGTGEILRFGW